MSNPFHLTFPANDHIADANGLKDTLKPKESELVPLDANLVDQVWGKERPPRPTNPIFPLEVKYAGKSSYTRPRIQPYFIEGTSFSDKIKQLRETLTEKKASGMVISMLDEVAWLFNLRGSDIAYNPGLFLTITISINLLTV